MIEYRYASASIILLQSPNHADRSPRDCMAPPISSSNALLDFACVDLYEIMYRLAIEPSHGNNVL